MRNLACASLLLCVAMAEYASATPIVISVNFGIGGNDNNSVDPGETSVVGNPSGIAVDGSLWNNVLLRTSGTGSPNVFISNTTGGNFTQFLDSTGASNGRLTSTLGPTGGNSGFVGVTTSPGLTGDSGLFNSYLSFGSNFSPGETLTISNLASTMTTPGYYVVLLFDRSNAAEIYGHTVSDGNVSGTFWTNDTSTDSDPNNDGVMDWTLATGTTSGTATTDANYSVFPVMHGSSFTITGLGTARVPISGLQIIAVPEPSTVGLIVLALSTIGARCVWRARRHSAQGADPHVPPA